MNAPPSETSRLPKEYKPKSIFYIYAVLFTVATLWLGVEAWKRGDYLWWIMFLGVGFITVRLLLGAFARAEYDGETFTYRTPFRPTHTFHRQQLALVEMGGRRNEALIIGYYPRDERGIITTDRVVYINCVPLEDQGELFDQLLEGMPKETQHQKP